MKHSITFNPLSSLDVRKKRVFLRADLNLPLNGLDGTSVSQARLTALVPTLAAIQEGGGKVILATHIGRPAARQNTHLIDERLSTKLLIPALEHQGFKVDFEPDLLMAAKKSHQAIDSILLLENLRFFQGEQEPSPAFAQLLAATADVYVNDAFGLIHRNDTSVTLLPELFACNNRAAGLIIEKEIATLTTLTKAPAQPFMLVVGGCKVKDKIRILETFLEAPERKRATTIIIGGALAMPFLKANGHSVGASHCDQADAMVASNIIAQAQKRGVQIILPTDVLIASQVGKCSGEIYPITDIPENGVCVDIGPASTALFAEHLARATTIFANGTMGIYEYPEYQKGTNGILASIAANKGLTIIAGGDTVAAAQHIGIADKVTFCSTGGGATLAFLAAHDLYEELPALKALS